MSGALCRTNRACGAAHAGWWLTMPPMGDCDLDVPCVTMFDACAAAGITATTLTHWLNREPPIILLRNNERSARGLDHERLLTVRRVLQIALATDLVHLGIMAQRAGNLAAMFTDQGGEKPVGRRGGRQYVPRRPGHLYASGGTTLVANRDGGFASVITAVVNAPLAEAVRYHEAGAVVVDVGEVVKRVLASLPLTDRPTVPATGQEFLQVPPHVPAVIGREGFS